MVAKAATEAGALKATMLAVAGAFHTNLMAPASEALSKASKGDSLLQSLSLREISSIFRKIICARG
jgi:hypothetical protein